MCTRIIFAMIKIKFLMKKLCICLLISLFFSGNILAQNQPITIKNIESRNSSGETLYFNFEKATPVSENESWDIGFNRSNLLKDAIYDYIEDKFENEDEIPDRRNINQSEKASIRDWYEYNPEFHIVSALSGKTYIIRLKDNQKVYKFKVGSYYKDAPALPEPGKSEPGFYTFMYQLIK